MLSQAKPADDFRRQPQQRPHLRRSRTMIASKGLARLDGAREENPQRRSLPPGRNRPTMGWRGLVARMMARLGMPGTYPKPSEHEQQLVRISGMENKLTELVARTKNLRLAVFNKKGGAGKTPTAAFLSCVLAHATRGEWVNFIDGNPGSTSPGHIMGMFVGTEVVPHWTLNPPEHLVSFRSTASVLEVCRAEQEGRIQTGNDLLNLTNRNHYGVNTLLAHPASTERDLTPDEFEQTIALVCDAAKLSIIDTGNELKSPGQKALARLATDHLYVALVDPNRSLEDLQSTMSDMRVYGYDDKANQATVVITGIPKESEIADYLQYVGTHPIKPLGVPFDPVIARNEPVDLSSISADSYEAYLEILLQVFETHLKRQEIRPLAERHSNETTE